MNVADGVPIVTVDDAWPVTLPVVAELNVTWNWPAAFVVPVNGPAGFAAAPFELVSVTVTVSPAAATKPAPLPVSFSSVTVNVCGWPTRLVASGVIEILALTQVLIAGPEFGATPLVVRVRLTPPTLTVVDAPRPSRRR